jgi:hypothetical protein
VQGEVNSFTENIKEDVKLKTRGDKSRCNFKDWESLLPRATSEDY